MNDPIEHNDFEKRLKKAAGDFLPEPSNRVWENVRDELHPRRRTYLLAVAAAILLLLAVSVYFLQRQYFHSSKSSLAEQTSQAQSDNNHPANHLNKNQTTQPEPLSGKAATENQQNKGSVLSGLSENTPQTNYSDNSSHKEDLQRNNRTIYTFNKEKINKSNNPNFRPFLINKNTENEQSPELSIRSQNAEITGLPYLKSLAAKFNSPSAPEKASFESLPFQDASHINNIPLMTSQENEKFSTSKKSKVTSHRKLAFEIFYTPSFGYRTLTKGSSGIITTGSSFYDQFTSSSASSKLKQQPEWSWSAGARIIFPFGTSWSLQTGLSAAEMNYRIAAYGTYRVYIQNNAASYSYYAMPARQLSSMSVSAFAAVRPQLSYLHNSYITGEIPLLINKQFGNSHGVIINIGAGAGLSYVIHSNPIIYSPLSRHYFTDNHYIRPVNGDFHIETSALIPLSSSLKLDIGPSFQYQIFSSYKNYPAIKEHPYLIGLKTGLQWGR